MLDFLRIPYNEREVKMRLEEDFGVFHRKSSQDFEHFTEAQRIIVQDVIKQTLNNLKESNQPSLGIESYLYG